MHELTLAFEVFRVIIKKENKNKIKYSDNQLHRPVNDAVEREPLFVNRRPVAVSHHRLRFENLRIRLVPVRALVRHILML